MTSRTPSPQTSHFDWMLLPQPDQLIRIQL